ncbi:hypothetical protein BU23DRAFT_565840 [Bimuria novae-zelandiae CBS 107.79]|uniref:Uncharacterized protein n=1 Tax=Bimuria novae-zelandiae CBS 107.79 TaxID=1447943 RepID=A0A6A5VLX6_9PLEO|nr:hypothetical protein BU23DRAFT_565840 [Bimuria novae-zelandiae CBS 107.79]
MPDTLSSSILRHAARCTSLMWRFQFDRILTYPLQYRNHGHDEGTQAQLDGSDSINSLTMAANHLKVAAEDLMLPANITKTGERNRVHEGAPSSNTPFPDSVANMTMVEILCYFPAWTTSRDIINRFISNGGGQTVTIDILMKYRPMLHDRRNVRKNILKQFQRHMRVAYGKKWTLSEHETPEEHNENSIDVGGFRTTGQYEPMKRPLGPGASVHLKVLADGITKMPTGLDALDLTRCVEYTLAHPDEDWMLPEDFHTLVERIGGLQTVTTNHLDEAIFSRYESERTVARKTWKNSRDAYKVVEEMTTSTAKKVTAKADRKPKKAIKTSITLRVAAKSKFRRADDTDTEDSDDDHTFHGSKRSDALGRKSAKNGTILRSDRVRSSVKSYNAKDFDVSSEEEHASFDEEVSSEELYSGDDAHSEGDVSEDGSESDAEEP